MTFESLSMKRPCVSVHVSSSFYMFCLDEIHVTGPKLIYEHVWVRNIWKNIPKDHPRVLEEGPKLVPKTTHQRMAIDTQWVSR